MKLTPEQALLAEENHNLIYAYLNKRNLDIEEYYGLCAIAFCRSIMRWNQEKGSLSTYAFGAMDFAVMAEKRNRAKRKRIFPVVSLDELVNQNIAKDVTYGDILGGFLDKNISTAENRDLIGHCFSRMNDTEKQLFLFSADDMSQQKIASRIGWNQVAVSRAMKRARRKVNDIKQYAKTV